MAKPMNIVHRTRILQIFLLFDGLIISSCSQKNTEQPNTSIKKDTLKLPVTIPVKAPIVTRLDTCLPPRTIAIPVKPGGSYVLNRQSLPPETKTAGFLVNMQSYSTEHGLALSSVV